MCPYGFIDMGSFVTGRVPAGLLGCIRAADGAIHKVPYAYQSMRYEMMEM